MKDLSLRNIKHVELPVPVVPWFIMTVCLRGRIKVYAFCIN